MPYDAREEYFVYSNTVAWPGTVVAATDPLLSIGGYAPWGFAGASRMYRQAASDTPHFTLPNLVHDTQIDGGAVDPVTGDWYWITEGANAPLFGKIIGDDQVSVPGSITIDQPLNSAPAVQTSLRTFKRDNMFDSVDAAAAVDGYVDYRQIWFVHNNGPNEGDFRFHIDPVKPNGCHIELTCAAEAELANGTSSQPNVYLPADRFEDPFTAAGVMQDLPILVTAPRYEKHDVRRRVESPTVATPLRGTNGFTDTDQWISIWLKRVIRPGTRAGECAFRLVVTAPDAAGPFDPDPYESGFIMTWFIDQPTYSIAITQDRFAYTDRSARLTATITDSRGIPVPNLNAWLTLDSGPGSVTSDMTGRTNALGQVTGLYNSPSVVGADPVVRCVIPTNTET